MSWLLKCCAALAIVLAPVACGNSSDHQPDSEPSPVAATAGPKGWEMQRNRAGELVLRSDSISYNGPPVEIGCAVVGREVSYSLSLDPDNRLVSVLPSMRYDSLAGAGFTRRIVIGGINIRFSLAYDDFAFLGLQLDDITRAIEEAMPGGRVEIKKATSNSLRGFEYDLGTLVESWPLFLEHCLNQ